MTGEDVMADLTCVFQQVFGDDTLVLTREMTAADVKGWDSFRMVAIVVAVEKAFSVRLRSREVDKLASVGDFADLVCVKRGIA